MIFGTFVEIDQLGLSIWIPKRISLLHIMSRRSKLAQQHLLKARDSALAAVDNYNRPGASFRTRTFVLLMIVAWTSCLHAVFYDRKVKPWYVKRGSGKGIRYEYIDGDPKHWELSTCVTEYWGNQHPPERKNVEFFLGLRNKIEHRYYPELDPALYGECQAMLMNFEDVLVSEFGPEMALQDQIGIALQFSAMRPQQQEEALRRLQSTALDDVRNYIETFRAGLSPEVLDSSQFSLRVFLIPKMSNNPNVADLSVEFVPYDSSNPSAMEELRKVTALIREKRVPVASEGLLKPKSVVEQVKERLPFKFTMDTHTRCWKHYKVRPPGNNEHPERTRTDFCIYDELANGYGYTEEWVKYLCRKLADPVEYETVTGRVPD